MSSEPPPPPRQRTRRVFTAFASLTGSLAIHIALVAGAATVVWHVGMSRPPAPRELFITFDAPGESATQPPRPQDAARAPTPEAELKPATAATVPTEASITDPAPTPAAPVLADLSGLSTAPAADSSSGEKPRSTTGVESLLTVDPGSTTASAATPDVTFAGLGAGHVRSVVYVVDSSGPMVTSLPRVTAELRRSIDRLSPSQKFAVVLFSRTEDDLRPVELFAPVLVRATPQAKRLAVEWAEKVQPRGASNPLAGLEAAIKLKPDAVFLLSRSIERSGGGVWELGREQTLHRLDKLNPADPATGRRPMLIQTIQFLDEDPTGAMQAIGTIHGRAATIADNAVAGYTVIRRSEDLSRR